MASRDHDRRHHLSPISFSRLVLPFTITQLIFLYIAIHNRPPACAPQSTAAFIAQSACHRPGLHGGLNPNAVATIILSMKSISKHTYNSGGLRHLRYILHSRALLSPNVNFLILTTSCPLIQLAHTLGIATIQPESGSSIGDLTYNHAFELVTKLAPTPIVGFANSDIIFLDNFAVALQEIVANAVANSWRRYFITGVRKNVDVPDDLMPMDHEIDQEIWRKFDAFIRSSGTMFEDITADYFLWNRDGDWDWRSLPPFVLGGIGFDNWIVGWASATGGIVTINTTPVVDAIHVNHGGKGDLKLYGSHFSPASTLNEGVFLKYGMIGSCDVNDLDWAVVKSKDGLVILKHQ